MIEKRLKLNPRNVPLLDTGLMILVIVYGIMKNGKSLGVEMYISMKRPCTKINCRERKWEKKTQSTQFLMKSKKMKFQRHQKIKSRA